MSKRYDIASPRGYKDRSTGEERTSWVRLGTAFDKGDGKITLLFDALPIAGPDGVCKAILMEPKQQTQDTSYRQTPADRREFSTARQAVDSRDPLDDSVPF